MADLSNSILSIPDVQEHFQVVERPFGPVLLHKSLPVYMVEYDAFPMQKQPRHWQVYFYDDKRCRTPWSERNRKVSPKTFGFQDPAEAVIAAMQTAKAMTQPNYIGRGYE